MNVKRTLACFTSAALLLSLAVGCGNNAASTPSSTETASAQSVNSVESVEATESATVAELPSTDSNSTELISNNTYFPLEETESISMWIAYPPIGITPEDYLIFQEAQQRLNIKLDFSASSLLSASEDFNLMLASGEYPDILNYFSNFYTSSTASALEQEIIMDMTDLMDEYAPDYQKARTSSDTIARQTMDDGKLLRFFMIHDGEYAADFGPAIRQDWLQELNLDVPATYDDWYTVGLAFLENYGATIALPASGTVQGSFLGSGYDITLPDANGGISGGFFQIDNQVHYGPYEDSFLDYLTMLNKWYQSGVLYQDFYSDNNGNSTSSGLITSGSCGIFWLSASYITEYEAQMGLSDVIKPIGDPVCEADQVTHMRANSNTPVGSVAISADCADPELAIRFMNYWYTEEGSILANYGVEDMTFQYGSDGSIQWTELITNNPDYGLDPALALYTGSRDSISYLYDDNKYDTLYAPVELEAGKTWLCNDDGAYAMPTDFVYDQDSESQQLLGDIITYVNQCTLQFIIGDRDLSTFEEYQAELKEMGIETVLDSYSQQCRNIG